MYFEQFYKGQSFVSAPYRITKEEIVEYAVRYDPQYIHVDEVRAKESVFGGIIAAGFHTASIAIRLLVDLGCFGDEIICGVGVDDVKFLLPVYPDDILTARIQVLEMADHHKANNKGFVTFGIELFNQNEQKVLSFKSKALFKKQVTA